MHFTAIAADGSQMYPSDSKRESGGGRVGDEDNRGVSSEERGHVDVSRMRLSICLFKKQQLSNCL